MSCSATQQGVLGQVGSTWPVLGACVQGCFNSVGVSNPPTCDQVYNSCNGAGNTAKFEACVTACPAGALPATLVITTVRTACQAFPPVAASSVAPTSAAASSAAPTSAAASSAAASSAAASSAAASSAIASSAAPTSAAASSAVVSSAAATTTSAAASPAANTYVAPAQTYAQQTNLYSSARAVAASAAAAFAVLAMF